MADRQSRLILQLVDRVTGPSKLVGRSLNSLKNVLGRFNSTAGAAGGLGTGFLAKSIVDEALELSRAKNALVAFGDLHEEQVNRIVQRAREIDAALPVSALDVIKSGTSFLKAGFGFEQTEVMLDAAARLQVLSQGALDAEQAARLHANAMYQLNLVTKDWNQTQANSNSLLDYMARAAKSSNTDLTEMFEGIKYAGPALEALGMNLEEISVILAATANAGYQASQGGVALRAAASDLLSPTKKAQAALNRLQETSGINFDSFRKGSKGPATSRQVIASMVAGGINPDQLRPFATEFDKILAEGLSLSQTTAKLTELIGLVLGDESAIGADVISELVGSAVRSGAQEFDMIGFLEGLKDAGATMQDFFDIFGERQGVRLWAIASQDMDLLRQKIQESNSAIEQSNSLMQGWAGEWDRLMAAISQFKQEFAEAGFMDTFIKGVQYVTEFLSNIKKTNPELLKFASYGLLITAAAGGIGLMIWPISIAFSAMATAAAALASPLGLVVAGLTALGFWVARNWESVQAALGGLTEGFLNAISPEAMARLEKIMGWIERMTTSATSLEKNKNQDPEAARNMGSLIGASLGMVADSILNIDKAASQAAQAIGRIMVEAVNVAASLGSVFVSKVQAWASGLYEAGVQMAQSIWDGMKSKWAEFIAWVQTLPAQIKSIFAGMVVNIPIVGKLFGGSGVQQGAGAPSLGGMETGAIDGAKARGGAVRRGGLYMTGERGPELFSPGSSGYIHNARNTAQMGSGGGTSNITINVNGAKDPSAVAAEINRKLAQLMNRSRQLSLEGRPLYT
jgi:hypothetical protein